jgi:hypothetical protein
MLLFFMELLEPKKTAQPHKQDPKDDLLGHKEKTRCNNRAKPRRRHLWLKGESL